MRSTCSSSRAVAGTHAARPEVRPGWRRADNGLDLNVDTAPLPHPHNPPLAEEYLTPDDVCVMLKLKKSWIYDLVQARAIPHVRLGRQLRFET